MEPLFMRKVILIEKPAKGEMLRLRCTAQWKTRVVTTATLIGLDASEFVRQAINEKLCRTQVKTQQYVS